MESPKKSSTKSYLAKGEDVRAVLAWAGLEVYTWTTATRHGLSEGYSVQGATALYRNSEIIPMSPNAWRLICESFLQHWHLGESSSQRLNPENASAAGLAPDERV